MYANLNTLNEIQDNTSINAAGLLSVNEEPILIDLHTYNKTFSLDYDEEEILDRLKKKYSDEINVRFKDAWDKLDKL